MKVTHRIEYRDLCFAIISEMGTVITAAPVASWCIGKRTDKILDYYSGRGAKITIIPES
jgi:hypothetical protein